MNRNKSVNLEQTFPRKLTELIQNAEKIKKLKKCKNRKKKHSNNELFSVRPDIEFSKYSSGMTRSLKPLPEKIDMGMYESESHYLMRLSKLCAKSKAEAKIEDRFDVDFCQRVEVQNDGSNGIGNDSVESRKTLKRRERNMKIREKKRVQRKMGDNDFLHLKDNVKFGEIVTEPPVLSRFKIKGKKINS